MKARTLSLKHRILAIPTYGWILGVVYFGLQYGMYRLGDFLSDVIGTKANAFLPKIPLIDDAIPVVPIFAVIYLFSYAFWIFGPIVASLGKKKKFVNYIVGLSLAYLVGFLVFVFAPSYMDRAAEGLTDVAARTDGFYPLLGLIYGNDGGTLAFNLFPSYHCLISLYCYLGVAGQKEIALWYRVYALVMTLLISLSTVFTKQHYFIDILGGLLISLLCYFAVKWLNPGGKIEARRAARAEAAEQTSEIPATV